MGTLPTIKVEADLNGTGTLVDISDYVADEGLTFVWGRTDWTAPEPGPGTLTLVLDNSDGRFSPGNTDTYAVGVIDGVQVKWTCGARVRWFVMGTPQLEFPAGSAASSQVRVDCYDALGTAARRTLRSMLDEQVLLSSPAAYWRLDESGSGLGVRAKDSSGGGAADLVPHGDAGAFGWASGQGPAADDGGALHLSGDLEAPATTGPYLVTGRPVDGALTLGTSFDAGGEFDLWVTIRDIYGALDSDDGVHLATLTVGTNAFRVGWFPASDGNVTVKDLSGSGVALLGQVGTGRTHLISVYFQLVGGVWIVGGAVDGVLSAGFKSITTPTVDSVSVRLGSDPNGTLYAHAGTVARVVLTPSWGQWDELWAVGQRGAPESVTTRVSRLVSYGDLSSSPEGTARGDRLGRQDTRGQSLLQAVCDALRGEDAAVDSGDTAGELVPWLYSEQWPTDASVSIDIEDDAVGVPVMSFDTSGVASTVTVSSPSVSVTWARSDPGRWPGTSAEVSSALRDAAAAQNLAQYRALLGRITAAVPSAVTVDLGTAENDITADMLGLRPGAKVTITGMPSDVLGYSSIDGIVIGGEESHTVVASTVTLRLMPPPALGTRWALYDGSATRAAGRLQAAAKWLLLDMTASQTTLSWTGSLAELMSTDVPYTIKVGDEHMSVTAVSGGLLTVTRGVDDTTAATHSKGDAITLVGVGVLGY